MTCQASKIKMADNHLLYEACLYDHREEIIFFLAEGYDVNLPNANGQTPLFAACISGVPETVKLLANNGAKVDHQDESGQTPLHVAFEYEHKRIAEILIQDFKANISIRNVQGRSPLHICVNKGLFSSEIINKLKKKFLYEDMGTDNSWIQLQAACHFGDESTVRNLLEVGTDVNRISDAGLSALLIACKGKRTNIIDMLLKNGADPNLRYKKGRTALQIAVIKLTEEVVCCLLKGGASLDIEDEDGDTPLHLAVHQRRDNYVQVLLDYGADVNIVNHKLLTPLHLASMDNNMTIISKLLEHNAEVDAKDINNATPLFTACTRNTIDIVRVLLEYNANPNLHGPEQNTPLHIAVARDNCDMVHLLLTKGANLKLTGQNGSTVLHIAASQATYDTMEAIIQFKPDVDAPDDDRDTPLHIAAVKGYSDKVLLLLRHGAKIRCKNTMGLEPFEIALIKDQQDVVALFLNNNQEFVDFVLKSGETLLHYCCRKGKAKLVTLLLKKSVKIDTVCSRGIALDAAFDNDHTDIVRQLISAGALMTQKSRLKSTFLERLYWAKNNHCALLQFVIDTVPDLLYQDDQGETIFLKACRDGAADVIQLLINSKKDIGINICNRREQSPVYVLCEQGNLSLLSILLTKYENLDVDKADAQLSTPLHIACRKGYPLIVNLLLRKSQKSLESEDKMQRRPIHFVRSPVVLEALLRWKVELGPRNYLGQTPLLLLCLEEKRDMVAAMSQKLDISELNANDRMGRNIVHLCVAKHNWSILANALKLSSPLDVNAKDINEQTGLHIAALNDDLKATRLLLESGADPNIPDKSGLTPLLLARSDVAKLLKEKGAKDCISSRGCDSDAMHAWREQATGHKTLNLWHDIVRTGEGLFETVVDMPLIGFIDRHKHQLQEYQQIKDVLRKFMVKLSEIVGSIDPLMVFEIMPSGSMNEGTKVGIPDEGDFVCILPKVSQMLVPPTKFTFHTTYLTLSVKEDCMKDLLDLVDSGKLMTQRLFHRFYQAVALALARPELWHEFPHLYRALADDISGQLDKISNVTLKWHGSVYRWIDISVDIVPALYFEGWKPTWCEEREVLKSSKCCIVAKDIKHAPPEKRPHLFQLCFTECDAAMFEIMLPELKEGYMLAKLARQPHICPVMTENEIINLEPVSQYISSYMLKTATYHVHEESQCNPQKFNFGDDTSPTLAAVACARMIYANLAASFENNYLEMYFVPAFDIFRNHFENSHDQHVAKSYCKQLENILAKNPEPRQYQVQYISHVDI